jgi:hypothetical protein
VCGLIKQINYIFFGLVVYNLFMKQASLFCLVCHDDISPQHWGAPTWFETIWSASVEAIDY